MVAIIQCANKYDIYIPSAIFASNTNLLCSLRHDGDVLRMCRVIVAKVSK